MLKIMEKGERRNSTTFLILFWAFLSFLWIWDFFEYFALFDIYVDFQTRFLNMEKRARSTSCDFIRHFVGTIGGHQRDKEDLENAKKRGEDFLGTWLWFVTMNYDCS